MLEPFTYQIECLSELNAARARGEKKALVVMASGLGKTVTAAFDAKSWLDEYGGRLLYLCHQNAIIEQSRGKFESELGPGYSYGSFHGSAKKVHNADCVFASFQTMRKHTLSRFKPDDFDYIVVDESHHTPAESHAGVVGYFQPKFLLGMTATPDRMDGKSIRSIYGDEVYSLPLVKALAQGFLTPVDYRLVSDEISLERLEGIDLEEIALSDFDKAVFSPRCDADVIAAIARHAEGIAEPRIIVFTSSIPHADRLAASIPGSAVIHSRVPSKKRDVRLEMFRQGMLHTAVTVDCFNEGIDIPEANIIVFLRSTSSSTIFFQQLGRGLRRATGKKKVVVLDFVGNCGRMEMLTDLFQSVATEGGSAEHASLIFDEKAKQVFEIAKRIRPLRVADVPELLREYSASNKMSASSVSARAYRQIWWSCASCGYEWQMSPATRKLGKGCPKCEERVTPENNLAVRHTTLGREYSAKNPVSATDIHPFSLDQAVWNCLVCGGEFNARIRMRVLRGDGCPACAAKLPQYADNFAFTHPKLAEDYSHLNFAAPEMIGSHTNKVRLWKCSSCGHEWQASVGARVRGLRSCPVCTAKVPTKEINLLSSHPVLAEEYSSRNRIPVTEVLANTDDKLWWNCFVCGRYWQASGKERLNGAKCPKCPDIVPIQA